jgi:hypothetical protein
MATYDDVASIELRRLAELEKQAALYGPQTEPAVLIEIQELRHKHGAPARFVRPPGGRDARLDYDFLMNTVAAALQRVAAIEIRNTKEDADRPRRQFVLNLWLGAISAAVLLNIALTIWFMNRLFGL